MANPNADYPSAVHTSTDVSAFTGSNLGDTTPTHTDLEGKQEEEVSATQTKLGIGSTTVAGVNQYLIGSPAGTTTWRPLDIGHDPTPTLTGNLACAGFDISAGSTFTFKTFGGNTSLGGNDLTNGGTFTFTTFGGNTSLGGNDLTAGSTFTFKTFGGNTSLGGNDLTAGSTFTFKTFGGNTSLGGNDLTNGGTFTFTTFGGNTSLGGNNLTAGSTIFFKTFGEDTSLGGNNLTAGSTISFKTFGEQTSLGDFSLTSGATITFRQELANGDASGAATINWTTDQKQSIFLTASGTLTFTAPNGPANILLKVINTGSPVAHPVTWPATVLWPGGTAPTLTLGSPTVDITSFYYDGTNYHGVASTNFQ